eukprot:COSAG01_NODE_26388_length_715_cov_2.206169_1_plen_65_part_10
MPGDGGDGSSTGNHDTGCAEYGGLFSFRSHDGASSSSCARPVSSVCADGGLLQLSSCIARGSCRR